MSRKSKMKIFGSPKYLAAINHIITDQSFKKAIYYDCHKRCYLIYVPIERVLQTYPTTYHKPYYVSWVPMLLVGNPLSFNLWSIDSLN